MENYINTMDQLMINEDCEDIDDGSPFIQVGPYSLYQFHIESLYHWIYDIVIDAYLYTMCMLYGGVHLESNVVNKWWQKDYTIAQDVQTDIAKTRWIICGANTCITHWTLLVADTQRQVYFELNSLPMIQTNLLDHFGFVL